MSAWQRRAYQRRQLLTTRLSQPLHLRGASARRRLRCRLLRCAPGCRAARIHLLPLCRAPGGEPGSHSNLMRPRAGRSATLGGGYDGAATIAAIATCCCWVLRRARATASYHELYRRRHLGPLSSILDGRWRLAGLGGRLGRGAHVMVRRALTSGGSKPRMATLLAIALTANGVCSGASPKHKLLLGLRRARPKLDPCSRFFQLLRPGADVLFVSAIQDLDEQHSSQSCNW